MLLVMNVVIKLGLSVEQIVKLKICIKNRLPIIVSFV